MIIQEGGVTRTVKTGEVQVGGTTRRLTRAIAMTNDNIVTAATFILPLSASANPTSVEGTGSGPSLESVTVTTSSTTVTPSGGLGPFTYSWARISGSTGTVVNPTSATTAFRATLTSTGSITATFRCTVTDSFGSTATADVTATFNRVPEGGGAA